MIALVALAGVVAIFCVIWVVNGPEPAPPGQWECDSRSPDDRYGCLAGMAHTGWCRNGDVEWRYDAWAIGCDDYTRANNPPIVPTQHVAVVAAPTRRIPRPVFWIGVLLVVGVANFNYDTQHPDPPKVPDPVCVHNNGLSCTEWKIS